MYKKTRAGWLKHVDFILLDILCLQAAFVTAFILRHGWINPYTIPPYRNLAVVLTLIDIIVIFFFNSYSNILKRDKYKEAVETAKHDLLVLLFAMSYTFLTQSGESYSRITLLSTALFYFLYDYPARLIYRRILRKTSSKFDRRSLIVVTDSERAEDTIRNILADPFSSYEIRGLVLVDEDRTGDEILGYPVVSSMQDAGDYIVRRWVDEVFIDFMPRKYAIQNLVNQLQMMGITTHSNLALNDEENPKSEFVETIGRYTVLTNTLNSAKPLQVFVKRAVDIVGGLIGTAITGILILVLGPMIKHADPGPIFFSQTRVGKNGRLFKIYKFRSMYMDAEERKKDLMDENEVEDGMMFKLEYDPRIIGSKKLPDGTIKKGIGNYIRDLSLDEFPQFLNVLRGEMSLVGTRPPTLDEWEKYKKHHRARLASKPGITGLWQVSGRSEIKDFEEVVKLDTRYIKNWTLGLDFRILLKTVKVVFTREGAM